MKKSEIKSLLFLNRSDNIKIERFNHIIHFELPTNDINIFAGNDFDYKRNIIQALTTYFNSAKEDPQYIEYNGDGLKIFHKDLLVSKKEYKIINLDVSNIDLNNELSLGKNSILRELICIYLEDCYSKTDSYLLINSILSEMLDELKNKSLFRDLIGNGIEFVLSNNDLTVKNIMDNILNIKLNKEDRDIPLSYLSFYEQTIVLFRFIEELINIISNETKIILTIDNIDCKLTNKQIEQLYDKIEKISKNKSLYIYIFSNNRDIINKNNNLLKTVIININESIVYLENYDELFLKINRNYPIAVSDNELHVKVKQAIINNFEYIGNFVSISDRNIYNIEDITIIKILNDVLEFKYHLSLENEYLNNRYYDYLTS